MPYIPQPMVHVNMHQVSTIHHAQPEAAPFDELGQVSVIEQGVAKFGSRISSKRIVDGTAYQYILTVCQRYGTERIIDLPGRILHSDTNVGQRHTHFVPETGQFLLCTKGEQVNMLACCLSNGSGQGRGSMPGIGIRKEERLSTRLLDPFGNSMGITGPTSRQPVPQNQH